MTEFPPDTALVSHVVPSPNVEPRRGGAVPDLLLLHYTGMASCQAAIEWLAHPQSKVSCHYVIAEDGAITQMAPEALRAWHAGVSHWAGADDINSCSIGIEIQNPGHELGYPPFPEAQMKAVERLCLDIVCRHGIKPERVLGHSDVAPRRKVDPGEKFDWARLFAKGVGHWTEPAPIVEGPVLSSGDEGAEVSALQTKLKSYGYGIDVTGSFDSATTIVVSAFQRHFRPALIDGRADHSTLATLDALIEALAAS